MKVAVTGGAGYLGAVVSARLLAAGFKVTVIDRLVYGGESLLGVLARPQCRLEAVDVRDGQALRRIFAQVEAVIHLAAVVGEGACDLDRHAARAINLGGTESALGAAAEAGIRRFLLVSTCSNYGLSDPGKLADEDSPLKPLGLYAETKVAAEQAALGAGACVLRFGTLCGLSPRMRFDLLVNEMARDAALGRTIRIFAPQAWRPFLHLADAARVLDLCLTSKWSALAGRVFNVVGENCRKGQLVELVRQRLPETAFEIEERSPDRRDYRVSAERIRRELEFLPLFAVADAFEATWQAVRAGVFLDALWSGHSAIPDDPHRWHWPGA